MRPKSSFLRYHVVVAFREAEAEETTSLKGVALTPLKVRYTVVQYIWRRKCSQSK